MILITVQEKHIGAIISSKVDGKELNVYYPHSPNYHIMPFRLHNLEKETIHFLNGEKLYYIDDKQYNKEDWEKEVIIRKLSGVNE